MRLALVGMGRMGTAVRRLALETGHEVAVALDAADNRGGSGLSAGALDGVDALVDFSVAGAVVDNVRRAVAAGVPVVEGTTGWQEARDEVRRVVEEGDGALVYASNFSLGAAVFAAVVRRAAGLLAPYPAYDPYVVEHHHRGKVDAPSGTALDLARVVVEAGGGKERLQVGNPDGAIDPAALHVASVRAGAAFGQHRVGFDADADSIELIHTARGREGFAMGALIAAERIQGRRGVFSFHELLDLS